MRLTGQAALNYMAQNPQGSYSVVNPGSFAGVMPQMQQQLSAQPQKSGGNFLTKLAGNIFDPFLDLAEGGRYLLSGGDKSDYKPMFMDQGEFDKYKNNFAGEALKTGLGLGSFFVPGGSLAKAAVAGAMSGISNVDDITDMEQVLKAGGMGALTGGATFGALKGASRLLPKKGIQGSSVALSDDLLKSGKTIGELQRGMQSGSANLTKQILPDLEDAFNTGNFTQAQKIIDRIDDPAYKATQQNMLNILNKGQKSGISGALSSLADKTEMAGIQKRFKLPTPQQGGTDLVRRLQSIGIDPAKVNTFDELAGQTKQVLQTTGKALQQGYDDMAKAGVRVDVTDVIQKQADDIAKTFDPTARAAKQKVLDNFIEQIKNAKSVPQSVDPVMFKKMVTEVGAKGKYGATTAKESLQMQATKMLRNDIRDKLNTTAQQSGFNNITDLNQQYNVAKSGADWIKYASKTQHGKAPIGLLDTIMGGTGFAVGGGNPLTAAVGVGISKALQSPQASLAAAKTLRGASNLLSKMPSLAVDPRIMGTLQRGAGKTGGTIATMPPSPAMASGGDTMGTSTMLPPDMEVPGQPSMDMDWGMSKQTGMADQFQKPGLPPELELQLALMETGMSPQDAKGAMESMGIGGGGGGRQLPPTMLNKVSDAQSALDAVTGLESLITENPGKFNPLMGRIAEKNPFDTQGQAMNAQLRTARQKIGKYLEGGVLRREDEIKYKEMLPNLTDTPDTAAQKLMQVKAMLENEYGNLMNQLQMGGYDPFYGQSGSMGMASSPEENILSLAGRY